MVKDLLNRILFVMNRYLLLISILLINESVIAQNTYSIGTGTNLVGSGSINLVFETGNLTNNGSWMDAAGTVTFVGPIAYSGSGSTGLYNLIINHASNTSILNAPISLSNLLTPTAGVLNANGNLTLLSSASATASVGAGTGAYITGNTVVQRYIPGGKRAFRFLSHPFTSNIAMSELTDNIDITGTGGSPFTATASNNPSAFVYDNTNGNSSLTNDPGWSALIASSTLNAKTAYRVLVRGTKGQANSLNGLTYTPAAVTLDWKGPLNTGDQTITLTNNGANKAYNFIGNPYASDIDLSLVTRGSNINANFSVWDPSSSTRGAYITQAFSASYILPSGSAFFTQAAANTNNTLTFTEASKSNGIPASLFRNNNAEDKLVLQVNTSDGSYADKLELFIDNANSHYTPNNDELWDAEKMANPDANLYAFSKDGKKLAIDRRPIRNNDTIQLGFTYTANANFVFKVNELPTINTNHDFYLRDKWLNSIILLQTGASIPVEITMDTTSKGNNRFEIITKLNKPVLPTLPASMTIQVSPNPARDYIHISYSLLNSQETSSIRIMDVSGKLIKSIVLGKVSAGHQNISMEQFANGVYTVQLLNGENKQVQSIFKQ
jgi:hypothetical protein